MDTSNPNKRQANDDTIAPPSKRICLDNLIANNDFCDIYLVAKNGVKFGTSKLLLCRHSSVFNAQFNSLIGKDNYVKEINMDCSPDVIKYICDYMLRLVDEPPIENLIEMHQILDKYLFEEIKINVFSTLIKYYDNLDLDSKLYLINHAILNKCLNLSIMLTTDLINSDAENCKNTLNNLLDHVNNNLDFYKDITCLNKFCRKKFYCNKLKKIIFSLVEKNRIEFYGLITNIKFQLPLDLRMLEKISKGFVSDSYSNLVFNNASTWKLINRSLAVIKKGYKKKN